MRIFEQLGARRAWAEDETLVLDQVHRLSDEIIAPAAAEFDRRGEFPWLNELGMNAIFVPEAYGGAPMRYRLYLECVALISEACASTGIIYATSFHAVKPLIDFGNEEQKSRLLPRIAEGGLASLAITEEEAGSDATGMRTRFTPDGNDIVVDGAKVFITSGDLRRPAQRRRWLGTLLLLFGKWSEIEDGKAAISALVLEKGTPGFEVVRNEEKLGHRASSTAALRFDACRVPRSNLLGEAGDGLRILLAS